MFKHQIKIIYLIILVWLIALIFALVIINFNNIKKFTQEKKVVGYKANHFPVEFSFRFNTYTINKDLSVTCSRI